MEIEDLIEARPWGRRHQTARYEGLICLADQQGISATELARRAGCFLGTIYNWKRRLSTMGTDMQATDPRPQALVQVRALPDSATRSEPGPFELRLRHGRSVIVPSRFDHQALATLVESARAILSFAGPRIFLVESHVWI
ncbi:MAG: hypothetical protein ACJAZN_000074 [Planctomycetota bacterium]|jgi:hypothetical protein